MRRNSGSPAMFYDNNVIRSAAIPYVPKQVELADLHENGKLLADKDIERLITHGILNNPTGIYDKDMLEVGYDVLTHEGKLWAIYKDDQEHELGSGNFGQALLVQDLQNGQFYAFKKQHIVKGSDIRLASIKAEFDILKDLQVVPYQTDLPINEFELEVPIESEGGEETIEIEEYQELTVLMELVKGVSIESLVNKERTQRKACLKEAQAKGIVPTKEMLPAPLVSPLMRIQIAIAAIRAEIDLQEAGYLHRDPSPGNIIFNPVTQTAKMIDFGHSRKLIDGACRSGIQGPTIGLPLEIRAELVKLLNSIGTDEVYNPDDLIFNNTTESFTLAVTLADLFGLIERFKDDVRTWENRAPIITQADHPAFQLNACGFSDPHLAEILHVLHAMTLDISENKKRMSMQDALSVFEALQRELTLAGEAVKTGVLDLTTCLDKEGNVLSEHVKNLQDMQVEEVWLIRSEKKSMSDMDTVKVVRQLEAMGFRVGDKVYIGKHPELTKGKLEQHLSKRSLPSDCDTWGERYAGKYGVEKATAVNSPGLSTRRN